MWSIFYQCVGEKFPHIFLMIELCLSAPYSNEIGDSFFTLMNIGKSDWHCKLCEDNIEALLCIKVEGPEIEEFIKGYSSEELVFWWDVKEKRKGGNGKWKKYKKQSRKTELLRFTNELPFLINVKALLLSTIITVRQN